VRRRIAEALERVPGVIAILALAASGIVGGHVGLFGWLPSTSAVLLALGAIFLLLETYLFNRNRNRLRRLEAEQPGLRARAELGEGLPLRLMRDELLALRLLAKHYSNERVSLYRHERDGFTLVARCSASPPFNESLGRQVLPLDRGVLGQAWADNSASRLDLPDAGQNDAAPKKAWLRAQQRHCRIDPETASAFTMRSQAYTAFRIAGTDGQGEGAILFESTVALSAGRQGGQGMLMEEGELEPLVKAASPRLTELLRVSQVLKRAEIRALLEAQQGPGRHAAAA
jgi:hypothetical protein